MIRQLALEKFPDQTIQIKLVSQGGMTLQRHWETGEAQKAIRSDSWDYVVLQEQSKLGMPVIIDREVYFGQTGLFFEYAKKFDEEIKNSGAQTVFFMTWSVKSRPKEQEILTYAYSSIAKELNAILAPVGLVWDKVRNNSKFDLYDRDESHPSAHGSYLVATTIFSTLFRASPSGLSGNISGYPLSSSGNPSLEKNSLVNIPREDARQIQTESWKVVDQIQEFQDHYEFNKPAPHYEIPVLAAGDKLDKNNIIGKWYGTSTYGSNYLGSVLEANYIDEQLHVTISFYSPDEKDIMTITDARIESNQLHMKMTDNIRNFDSGLIFSLSEDQLKGISKSFRNNIMQYNQWTLTKDQTHNDMDLGALEQLFNQFETEIEKIGYAKAAMNHFERYSKLVNQNYVPEEPYLNRKGYNLLEDGDVKKALDIFELAVLLYPQSVNPYDSYAEALSIAGKREEAMKILTAGYELAKKTNDSNLPLIEANLNKLKEGKSLNQEAVPPPPPPQP